MYIYIYIERERERDWRTSGGQLPGMRTKVCRSAVSEKCEKSVSLSYQSQCVLLPPESEKLSEVPGRTRVRTEAAQAKRRPLPRAQGGTT